MTSIMFKIDLNLFEILFNPCLYLLLRTASNNHSIIIIARIDSNNFEMLFCRINLAS